MWIILMERRNQSRTSDLEIEYIELWIENVWSQCLMLFRITLIDLNCVLFAFLVNKYLFSKTIVSIVKQRIYAHMNQIKACYDLIDVYG